MTTIYVPKEEAAAEVIKVNGRCYERVGPVARAPDTLEIEEAYQSCDSCQDSSSSGSEADSISGSGSTCECCVGFIEYFQGVSGEDAGVSGYSYPEPVCADGGVLALTFTLTNNSGATQEGVRITRYGDCGIITSGSPSGYTISGSGSQIDWLTDTIGNGSSATYSVSIALTCNCAIDDFDIEATVGAGYRAGLTFGIVTCP